ncbi:hypothetical protein, partial [Xenorhabdus santafensis]
LYAETPGNNFVAMEINNLTYLTSFNNDPTGFMSGGGPFAVTVVPTIVQINNANSGDKNYLYPYLSIIKFADGPSI